MGKLQIQQTGNLVLHQDVEMFGMETPYLPDESGYKRIALSDREWINPLLSMSGGLATDCCFGTYYLWGDAFGLRVSSSGLRLLASCGTGKGLRFFYPHGRGDLEKAICAMGKRAKEHGADLIISGVTGEQKEEIGLAVPGFSFKEDRPRADYIYGVRELASLSGKRFHGKKNHCNRFERENPDWHSQVLEEKHIRECLGLLALWEENHREAKDEMQGAEQTAIARAFAHYRELDMEGIALFAKGKMVGFSFGEPVGEQGFDVHFEKADAGINGAYAMVNREMARMLLRRYPEIRWLNREEDMGLENLRKAKESYRPAFLIEKYTARYPAKLL